MKRWIWPVFFSAPLLSGCGPTATAPVPPVDLVSRDNLETATFALG
jgi:hypothetical protein